MTISSSVVYVVDDDPVACESVAALLQSHGVEVQTFSSAEEFLSHIKPTMRGCILADVRMPGLTGLELQQELLSRGVHLPLIVITGYGDVPSAVRAMQAGAVNFLEKPAAEQELWATVQRALQRDKDEFQKTEQRQAVQTRYNQLSATERTVMSRLLTGMPNKQIAAELDVGLRTVEKHRANIMRRMQADSLAELVRMVLMLSERGADVTTAFSPMNDPNTQSSDTVLID